MLVEEEDGTFLKAFRNLVAMATEAREEQKRRVILRQWDDEEWWTQFSLEVLKYLEKLPKGYFIFKSTLTHCNKIYNSL